MPYQKDVQSTSVYKENAKSTLILRGKCVFTFKTLLTLLQDNKNPHTKKTSISASDLQANTKNIPKTTAVTQYHKPQGNRNDQGSSRMLLEAKDDFTSAPKIKCYV